MVRKYAALPTVYKGHNMRSRLEARWAVFFDCIGLEYQYEPQHYRVEWRGEEANYLPDFYLPTLEAYVEVKGGGFTSVDVVKVFGLSKLMRAPVLLLTSIPKTHAVSRYVPSFGCVVDPWTDDESYSPSFNEAVLGHCYWCGVSCRNGGLWDLLYRRSPEWGFHCEHADKYTEFQTLCEMEDQPGKPVVAHADDDGCGFIGLTESRVAMQTRAFAAAKAARF